MEKIVKATEEQLAYAKLLDLGMKLGLLLLIATFFIYMVGVVPPHVPVKKLPEYWGMSVHQYLEHANIEPGWAWVSLTYKSDFLNFIGIAFLAGVTLICYARILPILMKKKDWVYVIIAVLEILTLALAASGILKSGGH
ncbi:MAG TPA: hypothetical protein VK445_11890 [Dissulfurispiraceae bacterium]|nr:hypothetical protein [Dissulfurispiraceae bacterium]